MPRYQLYVNTTRNTLQHIRRTLKEGGYIVFRGHEYDRYVSIETSFNDAEVRNDLKKYKWIGIILPVSSPILIKNQSYKRRPHNFFEHANEYRKLKHIMEIK